MVRRVFLPLLLLMISGSAFAQQGATPTEAFRIAKGFEAELLYEVPSESQGSWVSLTVDPQGRLITSDQYGSLYRITLKEDSGEKVAVEKLDVEIGMAQGLLCAFDSLYVGVNARGSSGVFRVRDTNGDDQYDSVETLFELNGGTEHGPHALILSPDGQQIYFCAGNNTSLPEKIDRSLVPQNWDEDHLLGRMPDARGHNADRLAPGGFVMRFNPDGSDATLVATGFRNEYDIDFNQHGELFTYDADMEWDVGTPWYRPTRINHVISGAEFGWRNGTGKWPADYPDSFGAAVEIGPGSPTGICFGTGAAFPAKYQRALFVCDWSYGNIFAVHLEEDGATYGGTYEPFIAAAPLPVTDVVIHPDGAMYFAIGGRRTQSALYRVRYVGNESTEPAEPVTTARAEELRQLRRSLEDLHRPDPVAVEQAPQYLGHEDRAIRFAARVALEHQPAEQWKETVVSLDDDHAAIIGIVGLARSGNENDYDAAVERLLEVDYTALSSAQKVDLLRAYALCFLRLREPDEQSRQAILDQLDDHFPSLDRRVNRELAQVLVYLQAPGIIPRVVEEMLDAPTQEEQIHYAFVLRDQREGWTPEARRDYFTWFRTAAGQRGGASFGGFLDNIRNVAIETLSEQEKQQLGSLLEPPQELEPAADLPPRPLVKRWTVEELEGVEKGHTPDFERGKEMFAAAQCYKCHRIGGRGGILGPDLTGAGGRFNDRDLLVSILDPNKVVSDQYAATQFITASGRIVVGKVVNMNGNALQVITNMLDPANQTSIDRGEIEIIRPAPNSMMPAGLLDTLTKEEIADLLAYLKSGADPNHPIYSK